MRGCGRIRFVAMMAYRTAATIGRTCRLIAQGVAFLLRLHHHFNKTGTDDASRKRKEANADKRHHGCNELAWPRDGIHVAIAHSGERGD
eukprot:scaffold115844_cov29-Tisochrysis_lutea.AAC.3